MWTSRTICNFHGIEQSHKHINSWECKSRKKTTIHSFISAASANKVWQKNSFCNHAKRQNTVYFVDLRKALKPAKIRKRKERINTAIDIIYNITPPNYLLVYKKKGNNYIYIKNYFFTCWLRTENTEDLLKSICFDNLQHCKVFQQKLIIGIGHSSSIRIISSSDYLLE